MGSIVNGVLGRNDARKASREERRSIEAGINETRRQYNETRANLAPFLTAGQNAIPRLRHATSFSGLDDRLDMIMDGDTFGDLVGSRRREAEGHLARSGLRRSGAGVSQAADIPSDLALALEQMMYGREFNLVGTGQNAAAGLGSIGANAAGSIANARAAQGASKAKGINYGRQLMTQGYNTEFDQNMRMFDSFSSIFFSDERLKENMEPIGSIGELTLYEWDWRDGISDIVGKMSIGFSAQEVKERLPQFVREIHGFLAIDYPGLLDYLKEA
jgi:hypothetical protein